MTMISSCLKRGFDIVFSFLVLTLLSPLFLLIACVIKFDSRGPVFFKTQRLGKGGKCITVLKFRTMFSDAEGTLEKLLQKDEKLYKEWITYHKIRKDPRCTRIGKLLRKTSLDELPQFFCVLKGDLSVVGPRPYFTSELQHDRESPFREKAQQILSVKPGITGLWQTSGRNNLSFLGRIELDSLYVEKQSFFFDLLLILKTIPKVLLFKGAF
jgi:lipopolysaccharide/colanic/teichoic acid biosynthesis glycosyltransferase